MGKTFIGCKEAREVSLCKVDPGNGRFGGANPGAHVLMTKNLKHAPASKTALNPEPKDVEMTPEEVTKALADQAATQTANLKKMALWDDVTRGFVAHMPDDQVQDFMAKAPAEQAKLATEAKKSADEAEIAKKAEAEGKSVKEVALEKSVGDLGAQVAELQKSLKDRDAVADIEKAARSADYAGFPGGEEKLVPMLKAASALPEADRTAMHDVLKSQATMAREMTKTRGFFDVNATDVSKTHPATAEMKKAVKAIMAEKKVGEPEATRLWSEDPSNAATYERAMGEEAA